MKKLSKEAAELLLTISNNEELQAFAKELYPELGKKQLPKSWNELEYIQGYYSDRNSVINTADTDTEIIHKNVFATKEQAEAAIAMAQLSQLMKVYNYGWEADWSNYEYKYCIGFTRENLEIDKWLDFRHFLAFKDEETAELFLENLRQLIEQAKPLL